jgi:Co/Zn/Cd efflux system component
MVPDYVLLYNLWCPCFAGLVSDAFHLTFGCGLLTFSLFAMAASRTKPDNLYTYGSVTFYSLTAAFLCPQFLLTISSSSLMQSSYPIHDPFIFSK